MFHFLLYRIRGFPLYSLFKQTHSNSISIFLLLLWSMGRHSIMGVDGKEKKSVNSSSTNYVERDYLYHETADEEFENFLDIDEAEFRRLFLESADDNAHEFYEKLKNYKGLRRFPYILNTEIENRFPDYLDFRLGNTIINAEQADIDIERIVRSPAELVDRTLAIEKLFDKPQLPSLRDFVATALILEMEKKQKLIKFEILNTISQMNKDALVDLLLRFDEEHIKNEYAIIEERLHNNEALPIDNLLIIGNSLDRNFSEIVTRWLHNLKNTQPDYLSVLRLYATSFVEGSVYIEALKKLDELSGTILGNSFLGKNRTVWSIYENNSTPSEDISFKICYILKMNPVEARHFLNTACELNAYVFRNIKHVILCYGLLLRLPYNDAICMLDKYYRTALSINDYALKNNCSYSDTVDRFINEGGKDEFPLLHKAEKLEFYQSLDPTLNKDNLEKVSDKILKKNLQKELEKEQQRIEKRFGDEVSSTKSKMDIVRSGATTRRIGNYVWAFIIGNVKVRTGQECIDSLIERTLSDADNFIGFSKTAYEKSLEIRIRAIWTIIREELASLETDYIYDEDRNIEAYGNSVLRAFRRLLWHPLNPFLVRAANNAILQQVDLKPYLQDVDVCYPDAFSNAREFFGNVGEPYYPTKSFDKLQGKRTGEQRNIRGWEHLFNSLLIYKENQIEDEIPFVGALPSACINFLSEDNKASKAQILQGLLYALQSIISVEDFAHRSYARIEKMWKKDIEGIRVDQNNIYEYPRIDYFDQILTEPFTKLNKGDIGRRVLYMLAFYDFIVNIDTLNNKSNKEFPQYFTNFYNSLKELSTTCGLAYPSCNKRYDRLLLWSILHLDEEYSSNDPLSSLDNIIKEIFPQD